MNKEKITFWIKDKWEDFGFFIKHSFIGETWYFINSFPRNVKIVIDFIPLLWNSFDWDQGYLEELIVFKLKRMEKFFRSDNAMCMGAKERADEIKFVLDCFAINDDWDLDDKRKKHIEKYGESKMWCTPYKDNPSLRELHMSHSKCTTPEMEKEESDEMMKIIREEDKIRMENYKMAFNMMGEKMKNWWD